jgi:hypothetical protein
MFVIIADQLVPLSAADHSGTNFNTQIGPLNLELNIKLCQ